MADLKPCPFCGATPIIERRDVEPQGDPWYGDKVVRFVLCECGVSLFDRYFHEGFDSNEEAIAAWNRRATDGQRDTARGVPEGAFIPRTAEQMIEFIGSNFDSMQADEWTDEPIPEPAGDLNNVRYSLTVHDLLSAFQWAGLLDAPTPPDGDAERESANELWYRLRNPMTPFGMLVRTLRILTGTLLMDMARDLQTTPAELSAYECGRKPIPPELPRYAAQFFARHGIADTLPALTAAMAASKGSDDGR